MKVKVKDLAHYFYVVGALTLLLVAARLTFFFVSGEAILLHFVYWVIIAASIIASAIPFLVGYGFLVKRSWSWYLGITYMSLVILISIPAAASNPISIVFVLIATLGFREFVRDELALLRYLKGDYAT